MLQEAADLEGLGSGEEGGEVGLTDPHLAGVDEGEEGGEVAAREPGQVETEGTGGELGQDGSQFMTLRGAYVSCICSFEKSSIVHEPKL